MTPPSPKLMEKARKILVEDIWNPGFSPLSSSDFMHLREAIALALQQHGDEQRNGALEEAAKVAEKYLFYDAPNSGVNPEEHEIANDIRKLKIPKPNDERTP